MQNHVLVSGLKLKLEDCDSLFECAMLQFLSKKLRQVNEDSNEILG